MGWHVVSAAVGVTSALLIPSPALASAAVTDDDIVRLFDLLS